MGAGTAERFIVDFTQAPLLHCGRGRDPLRKQWEGEGPVLDLESSARAFCDIREGISTLTRLAALATLSRGAGEGQLADFGAIILCEERVAQNGSRQATP